MKSSTVASCGAPVAYSVTNVVEDILHDDMITLDWYASDPMNGMTRARLDDDQRGVVFDWVGSAYYELSIPAPARDFTEWTLLSLRACQGTRHPFTTSAWEVLTFDVVLRDEHGAESSISCGFAGGGIELGRNQYFFHRAVQVIGVVSLSGSGAERCSFHKRPRRGFKPSLDFSASPGGSGSEFVWAGFGVAGQLSQTSPTPSPSPSS